MANVHSIEDRILKEEMRIADEAAEAFWLAEKRYSDAGGYWATTAGRKEHEEMRLLSEKRYQEEREVREFESIQRRKAVLEAINPINKSEIPLHFLNNKKLSKLAVDVGLFLGSLPSDFPFRTADVQEHFNIGAARWKTVSNQLLNEGYLKYFQRTHGAKPRPTGYRFDFNRFVI